MSKPASFYIHVYTDGRVKFGITGDVDGGCHEFKSIIEVITPKIRKVLYKQAEIARREKEGAAAVRRQNAQLARRKRERGER